MPQRPSAAGAYTVPSIQLIAHPTPASDAPPWRFSGIPLDSLRRQVFRPPASGRVATDPTPPAPQPGPTRPNGWLGTRFGAKNDQQSPPSHNQPHHQYVHGRPAPKAGQKQGVVWGKAIKLTSRAMTLKLEQYPSNRILDKDDPSKFIIFTIDDSFVKLRSGLGRVNGTPGEVWDGTVPQCVIDYFCRMCKLGLWINGVQYRFYHHSNSGLKIRTCYFREANSDDELDKRIYAMGDFMGITDIGKRAKRIGQLFTTTPLMGSLDPARMKNIPDITVANEVFSDGCGVISQTLADALSKKNRIAFRGEPFTPSVLQIRYQGYKGVVMVHPDASSRGQPLVQFRSSMKKFEGDVNDHSFGIAAYSRPYTLGRLNNEIIILLSSLGVPDAKILKKQAEYFNWVKGATTDPKIAVNFLTYVGKEDMAQKVIAAGMRITPRVTEEIKKSQIEETRNRGGARWKAAIPTFRSRRLFGVCDPYQVLKEGQVYIRVTTGQGGGSMFTVSGEVVVVRNPCLYPGDCLKLRAVDHAQLSHLHDCIVFASTARPGNKAAPAMSSGGDLDGDTFYVCWDRELIPPRSAKPFNYDGAVVDPSVKQGITRADLVRYFVSHSSSDLNQISKLHTGWALGSPKGAFSVECRELNVLFSRAVDGGKVHIDDRLRSPPPQSHPHILNLLQAAAEEFSREMVGNKAITKESKSGFFGWLLGST